MSFTIHITRFSIGVSTDESRSELHINVSELPASKLSVLRLVVILDTGTGTKKIYTQNIYKTSFDSLNAMLAVNMSSVPAYRGSLRLCITVTNG